MKEAIGFRLKQERERLSLSQAQVAKSLGIATRTQIAWEKGEQTPNALHLATLGTLGLDIQFIVSGVQNVSLTEPSLDALAMSEAWEAVDWALAEAKKTLPPKKKRLAAEALYMAVRTGEGELKGLSKMLATAA